MKLEACVPTEMFVLLVEVASMRVDWRCALMTSGEQFAMLDGVLLILQRCANNSGMLIPEVSFGLKGYHNHWYRTVQ